MQDFDQPQSAAIFEGIVGSLIEGELGVAADFATNECDGSGAFLDQEMLESISRLVQDGSFRDLVDRTT